MCFHPSPYPSTSTVKNRVVVVGSQQVPGNDPVNLTDVILLYCSPSGRGVTVLTNSQKGCDNTPFPYQLSGTHPDPDRILDTIPSNPCALQMGKLRPRGNPRW